jgi:hypothetical protein
MNYLDFVCFCHFSGYYPLYREVDSPGPASRSEGPPGAWCFKLGGPERRQPRALPEMALVAAASAAAKLPLGGGCTVHILKTPFFKVGFLLS